MRGTSLLVLIDLMETAARRASDIVNGGVERLSWQR
jgi:hypothetical protein